MKKKMKKTIAWILFVAMFLPSVASPVCAAPSGSPDAEVLTAEGNGQAEGEYVITTDEAFNEAKVLLNTNVKDVEMLSDNSALITFHEHVTEKEAVGVLTRQDGVEAIEPNYYFDVMSGEEATEEEPQAELEAETMEPADPDPLWQDQYYLDHLGFPSFWEMDESQICKTPRIAVIDTGCDMEHPDIRNVIDRERSVNVTKMTEDGRYVAVDGDNYKDTGHGTGVLSVIAATAGNRTGIVGAYTGMKNKPVDIFMVQVLDDLGHISLASLIKAIEYAAECEADIINISLGAYLEDENPAIVSLKEAIDKAAARNIVVIAAAGNGTNNGGIGKEQKAYPAAFRNVYGIESRDRKDERSIFSDYGTWNDFGLCGEDILSAKAGGEYLAQNGTSFAAALFTAEVASILSTTDVIANENLQAHAAVAQEIPYISRMELDLLLSYTDAQDGGRINVSDLYANLQRKDEIKEEIEGRIDEKQQEDLPEKGPEEEDEKFTLQVLEPDEDDCRMSPEREAAADEWANTHSIYDEGTDRRLIGRYWLGETLEMMRQMREIKDLQMADWDKFFSKSIFHGMTFEEVEALCREDECEPNGILEKMAWDGCFDMTTWTSEGFEPMAAGDGMDISVIVAREHIEYGGFGTSWFQVSGTSGSFEGVCMDTHRGGPDGGTPIIGIWETGNEALRSVLYYGFKGPGNVMADQSWDMQVVYTALAASEAYNDDSIIVGGDPFWYWYRLMTEKSAPASFHAYICETPYGDKQRVAFGVDVPKGNLAVTVVSADPSITDNNSYYSFYGNSFNLYDEKDIYVASVTTDATGKSSSVSLNPGTYYAKQTTASLGYEKMSGKSGTVAVTSGKNLTIKIALVPETGRIGLQKGSSVAGYPVSLAGAEYAIARNADGSNPIETVTTGPDGMATTSELGYGMYYVKEISAPAGYFLNNGTSPVEVKSTSTTILNSGIAVENPDRALLAIQVRSARSLGYNGSKWEDVTDYTQLEYIESDGNQYIDLGIIPDDATGFEIIFSTDNEFSDVYNFGTILGTNGFQLTTKTTSTARNGQLIVGEEAADAGLFGIGQIQKVTFKNGVLTKPLKEAGIVTYTKSYTGQESLYLFAYNNKGTAIRGSRTRVYALKVFLGDVLVRNYIPVVRNSDGCIGLWDAANGTFTTAGNAGNMNKTASSLIAGPDIRNAMDVDDVYYDFTGTSFDVYADFMCTQKIGTLVAGTTGIAIGEIPVTKQTQNVYVKSSADEATGYGNNPNQSAKTIQVTAGQTTLFDSADEDSINIVVPIGTKVGELDILSTNRALTDGNPFYTFVGSAFEARIDERWQRAMKVFESDEIADNISAKYGDYGYWTKPIVDIPIREYTFHQTKAGVNEAGRQCYDCSNAKDVVYTLENIAELSNIDKGMLVQFENDPFPANGILRIRNAGLVQDDEIAIYTISSDDGAITQMQVVVPGNGQWVDIYDMPTGSYVVTASTNIFADDGTVTDAGWGWRYDGCSAGTVAVQAGKITEVTGDFSGNVVISCIKSGTDLGTNPTDAGGYGYDLGRKHNQGPTY